MYCSQIRSKHALIFKEVKQSTIDIALMEMSNTCICFCSGRKRESLYITRVIYRPRLGPISGAGIGASAGAPPDRPNDIICLLRRERRCHPSQIEDRRGNSGGVSWRSGTAPENVLADSERRQRELFRKTARAQE